VQGVAHDEVITGGCIGDAPGEDDAPVAAVAGPPRAGIGEEGEGEIRGTRERAGRRGGAVGRLDGHESPYG
jgi:hypothetical protein